MNAEGRGMVFIFLVVVLGAACVEGLSPFIKHYEPLHYDHDALMWNHHRLRRSLLGPQEIRLQFGAFGRDFDLRLVPDRSVFDKNFALHANGRRIRKHTGKSYLYTGYDKNDPSVRVHGNLAFGVFDGNIITDEEMYHVEPASRYLDDPSDFHSVIYRTSDLDSDRLANSRCGAGNHNIMEELQRLQRSAVRNQREEARSRLHKRQTNRNTTLTRCQLNIIADYRFFDAVSTASNSEEIRIEQAMTLIASFVRDTNDIYRRTDFDFDGNGDNIHFSIQDLSILTVDPATLDMSDPESRFASEFIGVESFLEQHSTDDWSDYCLSYRFTFRDFDGGVLGLAYVADSGSIGGLCENVRTFSGGVMRTLNTGIVTLLNYGRRVPSLVSTLTFAHEAGHNFGSQHDPESDPDCAPSEGKYIMFPFATDGNQPNNRDFSPCSRRMMDTIIAERGQVPFDGPDACFTTDGNDCRNGRVDDNEDCDCGSDFDDNTMICNMDPCCNGMTCMVADGFDCSPAQGDCCNATTCMLITESDNFTCAEETDCANSQTCNGINVTCLDAAPKQPTGGDPIPCNDGAAFCNIETGECTGSICVFFGLDDPRCDCQDIEEACHVCCNINGTCISTIRIAAENISQLQNNLPNGMGELLPIGFPCANFTGYCDFLNNCMLVDSEGALRRLANDFLDSDLVNNALDWIEDMWWVVVLIGVGIFLIMFFIVLIVHLLIPRPEHVKQRAQRRKTIRRTRSRSRRVNKTQPVQLSAVPQPSQAQPSAPLYNPYAHPQ